MANEPAIVVTEAAAVVEAAVVAAPAVVETAPAVAVVEAPAVEAAPIVEAKAEPAKLPEIAKPGPSLLGEVGKEAAPVVEGEAKPEAVAEVVPPTFESFVLPEGIELGAEQSKAFTEMLGQLELDTKGDHRLFQDTGQKLMDMYVADQVRQTQARAEQWNKTRQTWQDQIRQDPVLGRNRLDTVLRGAAQVRDMFATPRFLEAIEYTGMGDHPGMMDFVHNVYRYLDRHGLIGEGRPVPAPPPSGKVAKAGSRSRYANPSNAA